MWQDGEPPLVERLRAASAHFNARRLDEAARLCAELLAAAPDHAPAHQLMGMIAHLRGDGELALAHLRRASAAEARPMWLVHQGVVLVDLDRPAEARAVFARALERQPGFPPAHGHLGALELRVGRVAEALPHLRAAHRGMPAHPPTRLHLGCALAATGAYDEALPHLRAAVARLPDEPGPRVWLGKILLERGQVESAAGVLEGLVARQPTSVEGRYYLGVVRCAQGELQAAEALLSAAAAVEGPVRRRARAALAAVWRDAGEVRRAAEVFAELRGSDASDSEPRPADLAAGLASCQALEGRYAEAWETIAPWLDDRPPANVLNVYARLCLADRHGRREDAIERLRAALSRDEAASASGLGFALGELLDAERRYDEAWEVITRANRVERRGRTWDAAAVDAALARATALYTGEARGGLAVASRRAEQPVLVVGMPRSGTSLVEQILATHPDAAGAGELPALDAIAHAQGDGERATAAELDAHAERYLAELRRRAEAPTALRIVDKMPGNLVHLGLAGRLLPGARVINCARDPLDTCLSCYMRRFTGRHAYAYDLTALGAFYRRCEQWVALWRRAQPLEMMTVQYEDLVADPDREVRRLLAFAGLRWEPRCLEPHRTRRVVATASSHQVRRPIYRSSVGRHRHYDQHLGPLRRALAGTRVSPPGGPGADVC